MKTKQPTKQKSDGYRSVIIFLNRRCPVNCPTCNAGVSAGSSGELTPSWLSAFFPRLREADCPGYIIWTGGEPFLSFQSLEHGIALASGAENNRAYHSMTFHSRTFHSEILTAGAWFPGTGAVTGNRKNDLERLAGRGEFSLRISLDAEHQQTVPVTRIIQLIREADRLGIVVNFTLREIPGADPSLSPASSLETIRKALPEYVARNESRSRWLHYIPHMPPVGENIGKGTGSENGKKKTGKYRGRCTLGFRDLVIGENGLVYPCCGLFGVTGHRNLSVGDPLTESWETIAARRFERDIFRDLLKKGPYEMARKAGIETSAWENGNLHTPCQICTVLFG